MCGIFLSRLHFPKMILHLSTWDHCRLVSSLLYDSTGKNTLLTQLNQPFQDTETRIKDYIPTSVTNSSSSYAKIIPQYFRRGLQIQVDQIGGDITYLLPTQQQTRFRTMHNKHCATHYQMDRASWDRRSILCMSI